MGKKKKIVITLACIVLCLGYGKYLVSRIKSLVYMENNLMNRGRYLLDREGMEIINTFYSPDKRYKAIIYFYTGGGATVPNNVRVAVISSDKKGAYDCDVNFSLNRASSGSVNANWESDDKLIISYKDYSDGVIKKDSKLGNINILYEKFN